MIPQATRAVILSFYSAGRQKFVPLLTHEVATRAKVHQDVAKDALADVYEYGWVASTTRDKITTWELIPKGEKAARTLREAAEVVRSA